MTPLPSVPSPRRGGHGQRLAVILWGLILLAGFARGLVKPTPPHIGIYAECAQAGREWLAGIPLYPERWGWVIFPYSPLIAVFFVPFSYLPDALGSGLWRLTLGLAYLVALTWWLRAGVPQTLSPARRAGMFLLVIPLTATTVLAGQVGGLVVAAVLMALAAAAEERWTWSAVFAVVACLLKAYPVAVALLLAVAYPRRMIPRLLLVGLLGVAAPFLFQRPGYVLDQYAGWGNLLTHGDRSHWELNLANRNVSLLFRVWLTPLSPAAHTVLQLVTAAGAAGLCLAGRRAGWPPRRLLPFLLGLAGSWMTLFGPVVESYTYILVGPTLAWMLLESWRERRALVYRAVLVASWVLFTTASLAVWFMSSIHLHNMGPHPLAGLLLLGCLLWDLYRSFRARAENAVPAPVRLARSA